MKENNLPELLPCPFCGSERVGICREPDYDGFGTFLSIKCQGCTGQSAQHFVSNGNECPQMYQEVRDSWNKRADTSAIAANASLELADRAKHEGMSLTADRIIFDALRRYKLSHAVDEFGGNYPLVDLLTPDGRSISEGEAEMELIADAIACALSDRALLANAPQVPEGFVLMPMVPNVEMREVMNDDSWLWEDLLAAAAAITEDQYAKLSAPQEQLSVPERMVQFIDHIINGVFEGGDWDGCALQNMAVRYGLLKPVEMQAPCSDEGCQCAQMEADFPVICYRKTYTAQSAPQPEQKG